ncbi:MAG: NAD(P)-dependent oxidoreductase [Pleurocapsa sp. SU_196_0]|nr:NAD(P)-dependent oxidoreductase [Pleurocapsa sp. SU_196_0]
MLSDAPSETRAKGDGDATHAVGFAHTSTGASAAWDLRVPRILSGDFEPGGTIDISYKDQELETAFAKQLGMPLADIERLFGRR